MFHFITNNPSNPIHQKFEKRFLEDDQNKYYVPYLFIKPASLISYKGELIGAISYTVYDGKSAIIEFGLLPEFRHQGLGASALSLWLIQFFNTTDIKNIIANVNFGNEASVKLLKKVGFLFDYSLTETMTEESVSPAYTLTKSWLKERCKKDSE